MPDKEPEYGYVLTNPSFREDWVKIGNHRYKTIANIDFPSF